MKKLWLILMVAWAFALTAQEAEQAAEQAAKTETKDKPYNVIMFVA